MMRCDHVPINADLSASFDGKDIPAPSPACSAHNGASICIHSPQYYLNCHLPGPGTIRLIPASIRRGVSYSDTQLQGSTDRVMGSVCTEDICWS